MDPTSDETVVLLEALDVATDALLHSVRALGPSELDVNSRLPGWTRRTVIAHLTYGANATIRMLEAVPSGRVAFYPDGEGQRRRSLSAADRLDGTEPVRQFVRSCERLREALGRVPPQTWLQQVQEPRLGTMATSRLVVLRLNEVEVHHSDLDVGHEPSSWTPALVEIGTPLRIRWLGSHHRRRSAAASSVDGRWHLARTDRAQAWTVIARGDHVEIHDRFVGDNPDAVFAAGGCQLLAFLLGRDDLGQPEQARRFKRAFPGP